MQLCSQGASEKNPAMPSRYSAKARDFQRNQPEHPNPQAPTPTKPPQPSTNQPNAAMGHRPHHHPLPPPRSKSSGTYRIPDSLHCYSHVLRAELQPRSPRRRANLLSKTGRVKDRERERERERHKDEAKKQLLSKAQAKHPSKGDGGMQEAGMLEQHSHTCTIQTLSPKHPNKRPHTPDDPTAELPARKVADEHHQARRTPSPAGVHNSTLPPSTR